MKRTKKETKQKVESEEEKMPFDLAKKIANMLEEIQIINNENDKNIVIDNLTEDDFNYEYERKYI